MINKNEIKKLRSLKTKKGRESYQCILVEGKRLIEEIIELKYPIQKIWTSAEFCDRNPKLVRRLALKEILLDSILMQDVRKITTTQHPSGIIGIVPIIKSNIKKIDSPVIILDSVSDPGNLGTILRTANWFGISNVLLSEECVDPYNPKVVRSAMGAHFSMNIITNKIDSHINRLQSENFKIIAADLDTENTIKDLKFNTDKWALLLGNEAHGLSTSASKLVDCKIKIPQVGKIESLNVSVACGIFLYHISTINSGVMEKK